MSDRIIRVREGQVFPDDLEFVRLISTHKEPTGVGTNEVYVYTVVARPAHTRTKVLGRILFSKP